MDRLNSSPELPVNGTGLRRDAAIALILVLVGLLVRRALTPLVGLNFPYLLFFLAVIYSAWRCNWTVSLFVMISGLLLADWFFLPPLHSFLIADSSAWFGLSGFILSSLAVIAVGQRLQRQNLLLQNELSERLSIERDLREIAQFPNQNPSPVMRVSSDGKLLYANPSSSSLLVEWKTAVGQPVPPEVQSWLAHVLKTNQPSELEQTLAGRIYTFTAAPFPESGYVNLYSQDITHRRAAEEAQARTLRESEFRFRMMADASPAMIWTSDEQQLRTWFNAAWMEFVGRKSKEEAGKGWMENIHPDDLDRCNEILSFAFNARQPFEMEYRLRHHRGDFRWILDRGTPFYDQKQKFTGYVGSCVDVHDRHLHQKELEFEVRERTSQLQATVAELESFSYSIAHDMRAPLRAMHGFGKILMQEAGPKLDAPHREFLRRIISAANRLDMLIQDVLNFSRISRCDLPIERIELQPFIHDILVSYPDFAPTRAKIEIDGKLPAVMANGAALTQVISNLLGNAVKFVASGVFPHVRISSKTDGNLATISVHDNGIGIEHDACHRIFQMFQRLHRADLYEGTGIGLAIVRKAVERMGGSVSVESELGKGSTFRVVLQLAEAQ
jgi:PAS domain S-box-containing protein